MKTCLILLASLLLLPSKSLLSEQWKWQDGVIVHKTDGGYLYLFPYTQGRIAAPENPAGVINVGDTITVMYSLKLIGRAKTRFIGMDTSRATGVSPRLTVKKAQKAFGFFIRDTNQSVLDITIEPSFMQKIAKQSEKNMRDTIASQGNLNVTLSEKNKKVVIEGVTLD